LQGDFSNIQGDFSASKAEADEKTAELKGLLSARQSLTEEMKRLLKDYQPQDDNTVGGIPVDSEYIIFVVDTSGSMYEGPWNLVIQKITETLFIYPKVKGIQVLNDEGEYMFPSYAGKWMPDSPAIRNNITSRLRFWNPYSDSSPVEGITEAISTFMKEISESASMFLAMIFQEVPLRRFVGMLPELIKPTGLETDWFESMVLGFLHKLDQPMAQNLLIS
jgi:hypothetical protein